jgi:Cytochrome P460
MSRLVVLLAVSCATCLMAQPRYTGDGELVFPANYREWVFLSSGLGMSYELGQNGLPDFTNVFVNPASYRSFLASGKWPDKTVLLLEVRASANKGSINIAGSYQGDVLAIEGEVKDTAKFPGNGWAFFSFGKSSTGKMLARTQDCYACHLEHGAVDNTFVQFYPVLLEVAKQKGTLKSTR